jgi:hypothetical protein
MKKEIGCASGHYRDDGEVRKDHIKVRPVPAAEEGAPLRPGPGGSGINPFGPVAERRRATYAWLSNLAPRR